jgi:hypothetical protein
MRKIFFETLQKEQDMEFNSEFSKDRRGRGASEQSEGSADGTSLLWLECGPQSSYAGNQIPRVKMLRAGTWKRGSSHDGSASGMVSAFTLEWVGQLETGFLSNDLTPCSLSHHV